MNIVPGKLTAEKKMQANRPDTRELVLVYLLFLAVALIALFFCSVHSPFYRYSVNPDANAYMGVARALRHGLMPYRDVFDHKGLLLYLINYTAMLLSPKSMTGLYLILSFSLAVFLWYGYRIARMLLATLPALVATFPLLFFSVGNRVFYHDGGSTEEYLMPCLMACLFYLIRSFQFIEKNNNITSRRFFFDSIATGFFCGAMLWIKYTTIPAVGTAFLFLYIHLFIRKMGSAALRSLLGVFLGALLISIPCLFFLWKNDLFEEMWSAYITFNSAYIGGDIAARHTVANLSNLNSAIPIIIISLLGLPCLYVQQKSKLFSKVGFLAVLIYTVLSVFLVVAFGRYYPYYFLAIIPPLIFTTIAGIHFVLSRQITKKFLGISKALPSIISVSLILFFLCLTVFPAVPHWDQWSSRAPKTDMENYADAVNDYWALNGDGSAPKIVFFLSMDGGLLQLCDTYPQNRYYYAPNAGEENGIAVAKEQLKYIEEGTVDFIYVDVGDTFTELFKKANPLYQPIFIPGDYSKEGNAYCNIYAKVGSRDDS
jgi:hypothetical protein